ncbi:MAG: FAD-binding oxidoreductase [Candidatus Microsaccharimonas sossegonensis]|uniref:FAD-binding oxidoreductase n=1 Tax=Candidatus Microsaccharimonas sossegonensis TaxID=2506948 RepID=A0A4Q0AHN1_9BACT|nr:MAG: FAD-binding oxidoreductase [Candidatus Microsaccharimonas sossegonensis]
MERLFDDLRKVFKGGILTHRQDRLEHSHDASIYEIIPDAVLEPKDSEDIRQLVACVTAHKKDYPSLSITTRSAGTDMSGAAIGNSLILNMTTYFTHIEGVNGNILHTQPGVLLRDIDPLLAQHHLMLGSAPASRAISTIGGMVGNNAGGEQSLRYGNTERAVRELKVVFADGNEYVVAPLTKRQLDTKMKQKDFEGQLYRQVYNLIETNYDHIHNARPKVNKNSMGYNLWSVWDRETGIFDMTRLMTGSQGTLGIITDITIETVPKAPHSGLLLVYLTSFKELGEIIPIVMKYKPATFEGFDDITFKLGIQYFGSFAKQLGLKHMLTQQAWLLGSVARFKGHLPNILLMIEFEGETKTEVYDKIARLHAALKKFHVRMDIEGDESASAPFWQIRRASLWLLRTRIHNKYAAPFIDDVTVQPKYVPEFLPKLRKIIRAYKLPATISGHFGDGNFHIVPLLDIKSHADQVKLEPVMREVIALVLQYKGTLAGEHNDGMVRGPWLPAVFGEDMFALFKHTKEIFDPHYIFNPHKKTDASWEYSMDHIRTTNSNELIH